jgi:phosphohistidine phosphatase
MPKTRSRPKDIGERTPRPRSKLPAGPVEPLTLCLLRHGKSDWDGDLEDRERPLARRGEKAVPRMGEAMMALGLHPDIVLCSSAVRTRQTLELIRPYLSGSAGVRQEDDLYLAPPSVLLGHVHGLAPGFRQALIIGHNPGLHALGLDLVRDGPLDSITALARKLPTAGLVVIRFAVPTWADIAAATGTLLHFVTPGSLEA